MDVDSSLSVGAMKARYLYKMENRTAAERRIVRIVSGIILVGLAVCAGIWLATAADKIVVAGPLWSGSILVISSTLVFFAAGGLIIYGLWLWTRQARRGRRILAGSAQLLIAVVMLAGLAVLPYAGVLSTIRQYTPITVPGATSDYVILEIPGLGQTQMSVLIGSGILYEDTTIPILGTTDVSTPFRDGNYRVERTDGKFYLLYPVERNASDQRVLLTQKAR